MKFLLVEDDIKIASFLKKGLEEEYYYVDVSHDGEEAIYLASVNEYDLIILDIMLPSKDGYEVCKHLRANKISTPIIMLSAKSTIEDKVTFLNLGADDYLTKPFSFDELIARIKVQLRKKNQIDNILKVADLELNLTTKTVTRAGNKINLTAKEYGILEYLMRNKNIIVSEDTLKNSIQTLNDEANSNVLNVYIYRLRTKIDKNYDLKIIKTYRNLGFKVSDENI
ncbi:MAG: response regulator transcription factor [Arcobacteraceae bacterium]|jgi:DNA-binding response OmpR family regulator|nr:response regulator transcription factor [Arcobacteraceae bacterium]